MIAVVAIDDRFGIGMDGDLLFKCKEDQQFFKNLTINKTVVMGRKTYMSLPKSRRPLPERNNIVMTNDKDFSEPGITVCNSVDELKNVVETIPSDDVFVIGGEEIYRLLLPLCHRLYVTRFKDIRSADTFFPNLDNMPEWIIVDSSKTYDFDGTDYNFLTYEKIKKQVF